MNCEEFFIFSLDIIFVFIGELEVKRDIDPLAQFSELNACKGDVHLEASEHRVANKDLENAVLGLAYYVVIPSMCEVLIFIKGLFFFFRLLFFFLWLLFFFLWLIFFYLWLIFFFLLLLFFFLWLLSKGKVF